MTIKKKTANSNNKKVDLISITITLFYLTCKQTRKYGSTQEKGSSMEIIFEEAQILDLPNKYFKASILNMFKERKKTMSKQFKESMTIMSHQIGNIQ